MSSYKIIKSGVTQEGDEVYRIYQNKMEWVKLLSSDHNKQIIADCFEFRRPSKLTSDFILDIINTLRREYKLYEVLEFFETATFNDYDDRIEVVYDNGVIDLFYKMPSITLVHESDC